MKSLVLFLLITLSCTCSHFVASAQFTSHALSNRRIGYVNDASSVSWNPALLGMVQSTDILLASLHDKEFTLSPQYAAFAKLGGLAAGIILPRDSVSAFQNAIPMTLHAGYGFPLVDEYAWLGGGLKYTDDGLYQVRYAASLMLSLHSSFYLSGGIDNLYTINENHQVMSFMSAYSPLDWLTVHARLLYAKDSVIFAGGNYSPELGISAGIVNDFLIGSIAFNPVFEQLRIGLEMNLGGFSVGTLNNITTQSGVSEPYSYGIAIARLNFSGQKSIAMARNGIVGSMCHPDELRWRPFFSNNRNELFRIMKKHGGEHEELALELESKYKNSGFIYDSIHADYYAKYEPRVKAAGMPQSLIGHTNKDYSVIGLSREGVNESKSIRVMVQDKSGRMMTNISDTSFTILDSNLQIASVKQAVSDNPVPVDFVVLMDCSGSMGDEIDEVRANVSTFVQKLKGGGIDYRLGCILFGESIFGSLEPTPNILEFQNFFKDAAATGFDEITSTAIEKATKMNFRPNAQRVFILITDECTIQTNGSNTEISLIERLWNNGVKLYSVVNAEENNGAVLTRLSLGKEFSIRQPFTSILNEIAKDVSTTYEIQVQTKAKPLPPKVTVLKGIIRGDDGNILNGNVSLKKVSTVPMNDSMRTSSKEYSFVIPNLVISELVVQADGYQPYSEMIDFTYVTKGDTLIKDITLKKKVRTVLVKIVDASGNPMSGAIFIKEKTTGNEMQMQTSATSGLYSAIILPGRSYSIGSSMTEYTCSERSIDDASFDKGDTLEIQMQCKQKEILVSGVLRDEIGNPLTGTILVEDIKSGMKLMSITTDLKGYYSFNIASGIAIRLTPNKQDFIPQSIEVSTDTLRPGASLLQNLQMIGIKKAIADGMTFSLKNIFFDSNKSDIKPESEAELQKLLKFLNENPSVCLEIAAHTDNVGSDANNLILSQKRAESVVQYLVSKGIGTLRLKPKGYGEEKPKASNNDEAGRLLNRRVEFSLLNC